MEKSCGKSSANDKAVFGGKPEFASVPDANRVRRKSESD